MTKEQALELIDMAITKYPPCNDFKDRMVDLQKLRKHITDTHDELERVKNNQVKSWQFLSAVNDYYEAVANLENIGGKTITLDKYMFEQLTNSHGNISQLIEKDKVIVLSYQAELERVKGECWLPEWFVKMLKLGADDGYCINLDDATVDGKIQTLSVLKWDDEFKEWRQIQSCKLTRIDPEWWEIEVK